jgi:hypothetical protein
MIFQLPEGDAVQMNAEYDEEVTIRRTLSPPSKSGGFQAADEK